MLFPEVAKLDTLMQMQLRIRAATAADAPGLATLARYLNTVNLPDDPARIAQIASDSEASFSGAIVDVLKREYVFLLEDAATGETLGTSMIVAQLGNRDSPYIYVQVETEERYSSTLDRHFEHTVLNVGFSYNGPTEIGGLVVHPDHRRGQHGRLISYVRFLFLALYRERFRPRVLAELLPPLESDGTSHLWEAVGRHFTGLTYREADRLSKKNKEFIRGLFPEGDIYASLLSPEAQSVIGKVGADTKGVEKMLRRIGFRYWNRVDPFDGGPHFVADLEEISLVRATERGRVERATSMENPASYLLAFTYAEAPYFLAFSTLGEARLVDEAKTLFVPEDSDLPNDYLDVAWLRLNS